MRSLNVMVAKVAKVPTYLQNLCCHSYLCIGVHLPRCYCCTTFQQLLTTWYRIIYLVPYNLATCICSVTSAELAHDVTSCKTSINTCCTIYCMYCCMYCCCSAVLLIRSILLLFSADVIMKPPRGTESLIRNPASVVEKLKFTKSSQTVRTAVRIIRVRCPPVARQLRCDP